MHNPGDPSYRRSLGDGGLVLRWSTAADKAGCVMLACLAVQDQQGQESERAVRFFETSADDTFYSASSTSWALCVDTTPISQSQASAAEGPESHVAKMRRAADTAPERVVALIYFAPAEFAFDRNAVRVPMGKALIVACKPAYRRSAGGKQDIMKALFEMVNARAQSLGCAFTVTAGIPQYYRIHGYEYALNMGRGLVTHAAALRPPAGNASSPSPYTLRQATIADLPALERLVFAQRATAEIFAGVVDAAAQLRWLLGDRPAGYDLAVYPADPFFVLETRDAPHIVAAAALKVHGPVASISPLLWDGQEDASAVALALVPQLINAVEARPSSTKLAMLRWVLPDAHPLRRWLLAHELAVAEAESSRYDQASAWWVSIPSLPRFLSALAPALSTRLAHATHILGANYTGTLHISAPRARGGGAIVRVASGVVAVEPASSPSSGGPAVNVALPHGALIQLVMGHRGWAELKAVFPDVAVEPAVLPLVEVLFPKRSVGSTMSL